MAPSNSTTQAAPAKPAAATAASSSQAAASSCSDWQTVKTSGTRAKGRGQPAGPPNPRAAPAYASASPLDFQEPWRDEPESSSQTSVNTSLQQNQRQTVAPAEDGLLEDWEEAASAVESCDDGLVEAAAAPEGVATEAGFLAPDDGSFGPVSALTDKTGTDGKFDALSAAIPAHAHQAEAEAADAPASSHTEIGTAEPDYAADGGQEGALAAEFADGRQEALSVAAQESASSDGEADAAQLSANDLEGTLLVSEAQPAHEAAAAAAAAPSPDSESLSTQSGASQFPASSEEEVHASDASESHRQHASHQSNAATSLLASDADSHLENGTGNKDPAAAAEQDGLLSMEPCF